MPRLPANVRAAIKSGPVPKLRDWRRLPLERLTRGETVCRFIAEYLRVPEGAKVGQPIELAPFQQAFILAIYDNPAGTRRAYLSISRKNGKSALIAALLLAHIVGPEAKQNSHLVSGAMSRDQAALVWGLADKMIRLNPELNFLCQTTHSAKRIIGKTRNIEYRAISADASTAHGLSPALAILDEVGQVRGPSSPFIEAITTSQGAHEHPILIAISTSAPSDADMFSLWCDDAERSGDPHTVCHVYAADNDCDVVDKKQWRKANPAIGLFRNEKDLEEQLKRAARIPAQEASARNLLLNQRIAQVSLFLAPGPWKTCTGAIDLDVFRRHPVAVGLDLSARTDLTAAVLAACDDDGVVHLLPFVFAPLEGLEARSMRDRAPYSTWVRDGKMIGLAGRSMEYDQIATTLRDQLLDLEIDPAYICFDRWGIHHFRRAAEEVGFATTATWLEVGQGYRDFSPRCKAFESLVLNAKLRTGNHPLLNLAAANAVVQMDPASNIKLTKSSSTQRIDPLVAAIMAAFQVTEGQEAVPEFDVAAIVGGLAVVATSIIISATSNLPEIVKCATGCLL